MSIDQQTPLNQQTPIPLSTPLPTTPAERLTLTAYLRGMFNLAWSALRHPLLRTEIDFFTGRVIRHY